MAHIPEIKQPRQRLPLSRAPRFVPVVGSMFEPYLSRGDLVGVLPVDDYCGEGCYLLTETDGQTLAPFFCQGDAGAKNGDLRVARPPGRNPAPNRTAEPMTRQAFRDRVAAVVIAECKLPRPDLLEDIGFRFDAAAGWRFWTGEG